MVGENMFLFWGSGSVPCWKAMIALEEKGFGGYSNKMCSFANNEHKSKEIKLLNPRCQLPTFKDGDAVVNESIGIVEYLESEYPNKGTKLLPEEKTAKAKVYQIIHEICNLQKVMLDDIVYYQMYAPKGKFDKSVLKERHEKLRAELKFWETKLKRGGPYIAGPTFTMADCIFFPYLGFGRRLGLKIQKWPALDSYYNRVVNRPSVQASWPPHWRKEQGDKTILEDV